MTKIIINREKFVKSLAKVQSIVERRCANPILEYVKIEILNSKLTLTTTDMNIAVTEIINDGCTIEHIDLHEKSINSHSHNVNNTDEVRCSFTTIALTLYDIVRKLYDSEIITLNINKNKTLFLESLNSKFILPCLSSNEFPAFNIESAPFHILNIKVSNLHFLLNQTKHAICLNESRYSLNGTYLCCFLQKFKKLNDFEIENDASHNVQNNNKSSDSQSIINNISNVTSQSLKAYKAILRAVATDSHRLASAETEVDLEFDATINNHTYDTFHNQEDDKKLSLINNDHNNQIEDLDYTSTSIEQSTVIGVIVPRKTVVEVIKLIDLQPSESEVKILIENHSIVFSIGTTTLISKVIDANFPHYEEILMIDNQNHYKLNCKDLIKSIDLVNTVADGKNGGVKFTLEHCKLTITVDNNVINRSSAMQQINCEDNSSKKLEILLNSKYVMDCLFVIQGKDVKFEINNSECPVIVRDIMHEKTSVYVLMPMHLSE